MEQPEYFRPVFHAKAWISSRSVPVAKEARLCFIGNFQRSKARKWLTLELFTGSGEDEHEQAEGDAKPR